jgi:hypothetical protein
MRRRLAFVASLVLALPSFAWALDQGHFRGLGDEDLDRLLTAFQSVKVHYLATTDGNSTVSVVKREDPKVSLPVKYAMFLYFNPKDAEIARSEYNKTNDPKAVVRTAPAVDLIRAQFSRRDSPPSEDPNHPDFVILLSLKRSMDVIEYLARKNRRPFTVKSSEGGEVVPAHLDRDRAIRQQSDLGRQGIKVDRVGLEERSFLQFVVSTGQKGRSVRVEGFE